MKNIRKHSNRWFYAIAGLVIVASALTVAYHRHSLQVERSRHVRRPLLHDASSVADSQMLQGKFGNAVSAQDRQAVEAALRGSDQANPTGTQAAQTEAPSGRRRIALTQPLGTTVEDTEPTLTWDAPSDGLTYRVHIEDQATHRAVATSEVLDEAIWRVSISLPRGRGYLWRVDVFAAGNRSTSPILTSAIGQFSVLSDEGETQIRNARSSNPSHLLLGALYTHYQMWPEAVLEYRKLVDEVPNSPEAIKLLRNAEIRSKAQLAATAPQ